MRFEVHPCIKFPQRIAEPEVLFASDKVEDVLNYLKDNKLHSVAIVDTSQDNKVYLVFPPERKKEARR